MNTSCPTIRIFISSPGDVNEERDKARLVIDRLQRRYPNVTLLPVLWQDLALPATASFQATIDYILQQKPIDIAVFILWSRLGSPLGPAITRADGTQYRSGTEREFDLMLAMFERSNQQRPVILVYTRDDESGFHQALQDRSTDGIKELVEQRHLTECFIREQFKDAEGHNLRAYHSYREPISFAQRLHTHLSQALDQLLGTEAAPRWQDDPYRGLEVFDIEHAPIFLGRDKEIWDILQRLRDQEQTGSAFVVIVGASGSGKSSLARAGVAAALMQHAYDDNQWRVATLFPGLGGNKLHQTLARALVEQLPELSSNASALDAIAVGLEKDALLTVKLSLDPAYARASESASRPVRTLLLVDQLEELWTAPAINAQDRETFLETLEILARSGHIAVLATLRSDFYPHAQSCPAFLRLKGDRGHFDLLPPSAAALHHLIIEPARLAGVQFQREAATGRSLDEMILKDALRDPSALPMLQYALRELYQQRDTASQTMTFAAYESMNGVEGALGKRATETLQSLPPEVRAALTDILPLLVTIDTASEQSTVRRRAPLTELLATPNCRILTEKLIASRFLTTDRQDATPIVTLAHEALLRHWNELAVWVSINREHLRLRARVEQSQLRWEKQLRDPSLLLPSGLLLEEGRQLLREAPGLLAGPGSVIAEFIRASVGREEYRIQSQRKRRQAITLALSALTILALIGGSIAWVMKQDATAQRDDAIQARKEADLQKGNAQLAAKQAIEAEERVTQSLKFSANTLLGIDAVPSIQDLMPDIGDYPLNPPEGADRVSLYRVMDLAAGLAVPEGQEVSTEALLEFLVGLELMRDRKSTAAKKHIMQAADRHPEIRLFSFAASVVAANVKDYPESVARARSLVARFPKDAEIIFHLADVLDNQRLAEPKLASTIMPEIRQLCQLAMELSPAYISPRLLLLQLAEVGSQDELREAEPQLRELLEATRRADVRRALVTNLRLQKQFEAALEENKPLIAGDSPPPFDRLANARILRQIGRFREAISAFEEWEAWRATLPVNSTWSNHVEHLNDWGVAHIQLREFKQALDVLHKAKSVLQGNPAYEHNVATALLGNEEFDQALSIFQNIAATASIEDKLSANVGLVHGLICAGHSQKAIDIFRNSNYEAPTSPRQFDFLFVGLSELAALVSGTDAPLSKQWKELEAQSDSANDKWDYFYLQRFSRSLSPDIAAAFTKQLDAIQRKVPSHVGQ